MYKEWEGTNVKARYEFNNDPIKKRILIVK